MVTSIKDIELDTPDLTIDCSSITMSREIHEIMKNLRSGRYGYAMEGNVRGEWKPMKAGESSDNSRIYGERIARQVGNLPGVIEDRKSGNGKDIVSVVKAFEKKYDTKVHKDNVRVKVWDVTQIQKTKYHERRISQQAEDALLTQYEQRDGCIPVGNFKDTRPRRRAMAGNVPYDTATDLFGDGVHFSRPGIKTQKIKNPPTIFESVFDIEIA